MCACVRSLFELAGLALPLARAVPVERSPRPHPRSLCSSRGHKPRPNSSFTKFPVMVMSTRRLLPSSFAWKSQMSSRASSARSPWPLETSESYTIKTATSDARKGFRTFRFSGWIVAPNEGNRRAAPQRCTGRQHRPGDV